MNWYRSTEYRPIEGQYVRLWNAEIERESKLYIFCSCDSWCKSLSRFPFWQYVFEEKKPIKLNLKKCYRCKVFEIVSPLKECVFFRDSPLECVGLVCHDCLKYMGNDCELLLVEKNGIKE